MADTGNANDFYLQHGGQEGFGGTPSTQVAPTPTDAQRYRSQYAKPSTYSTVPSVGYYDVGNMSVTDPRLAPKTNLYDPGRPLYDRPIRDVLKRTGFGGTEGLSDDALAKAHARKLALEKRMAGPSDTGVRPGFQPPMNAVQAYRAANPNAPRGLGGSYIPPGGGYNRPPPVANPSSYNMPAPGQAPPQVGPTGPVMPQAPTRPPPPPPEKPYMGSQVSAFQPNYAPPSR